MRVRTRASLALVLWGIACAAALGAEPVKESRPGVYRGYSQARYSEWL